MFEKFIELLNDHVVQAVAVFLLMSLEYWLGKTELVKPGSTLEAILTGIKKILDLVFKPKPKV